MTARIERTHDEEFEMIKRFSIAGLVIAGLPFLLVFQPLTAFTQDPASTPIPEDMQMI